MTQTGKNLLAMIYPAVDSGLVVRTKLIVVAINPFLPCLQIGLRSSGYRMRDVVPVRPNLSHIPILIALYISVLLILNCMVDFMPNYVSELGHPLVEAVLANSHVRSTG